jgi:hypothetical protein
MVPVSMLWEHYKECGALADETWQKLQEVEADISKVMRPVFLLRYTNRDAFRLRHMDEEQSLKAVKKSLIVD